MGCGDPQNAFPLQSGPGPALTVTLGFLLTSLGILQRNRAHTPPSLSSPYVSATSLSVSIIFISTSTSISSEYLSIQTDFKELAHTVVGAA